jgi:hypothetical protein
VTLGTRHREAPELAELPSAVRISSFPEAATSDVDFIASSDRKESPCSRCAVRP